MKTVFNPPLLGRTLSGLAPRTPLTRTGSSAAIATMPTTAINPLDENPVDQIEISKKCDSAESNWPPYNGCNDGNNVTITTLQPGTLIDRFGSLDGEFFSPAGEKYKTRSLKQIINSLECKQFYNTKYSINNNYKIKGISKDEWRLLNNYEVLIVKQPLDVVQCEAAPAFGQPGGAIQFWVPKDLKNPFSVKPDGKPDNYTINELITKGDIKLLDKQYPPAYDGGFIKRKTRAIKKIIKKNKKTIKRKGKYKQKMYK